MIRDIICIAIFVILVIIVAIKPLMAQYLGAIVAVDLMVFYRQNQGIIGVSSIILAIIVIMATFLISIKNRRC